ncbi:hypothetical protein BDQ12DRAFT_617414, partial [Crucibulum laeve]
MSHSKNPNSPDSREPRNLLFPRELIDMMIDFLHKDRQALKQCSLVCRGWVPATRYHLYGSWSISAYAWQNFHRTLLLLSHPLCTFTSSIRHFSI